MSGPQRRAEHVKCLAESMGDGCLCEWHDDEQDGDSEVSAAQVP
jgi:hypothetical protein